MRLVWAIIPLVLFSIFGISESFATLGSSLDRPDNFWYVGEGLKQGDYFEYSLCHMDYDHCEEIRMKIWIEGDIQVGSETKWLAQVVVYEGNKIIKGEMEFGKITAVPTDSSEELSVYRNIFKNSVSWLSAFGGLGEPIDLSERFGKIGELFSIFIHPNYVETISIPAGTFDAEVVSWGGMGGNANNIWVVDDFPFPIKALVFVFDPVDDMNKEYEFLLVDYKENLSGNLFFSGTGSEIHVPSLKQQLADGIASENIQCSENRVLVIRNNGNPACVTERTAERIGWNIINLDFNTNVSTEQTLHTKDINDLQTSYAKLYPVPEGLKEPPQKNFVLFQSHISKNYPNLNYEELFRSWSYSDDWIQEFFSIYPDMKNKPGFVRDKICKNGVFFEDPLNTMNKHDRWLWSYLDCIYPEQLMYDLSNYDYITREDGLKMLSPYHESDGTLEKKVDFRPMLRTAPYCNPVYYHVFEYPKKVKFGEEFSLNVTYSWLKPVDLVDDHHVQMTSERQFNPDCESSLKLIIPRQMHFVEPEILDKHHFSEFSHRFIAEKYITFNNTSPQIQSFRFIVTEPVFELYDIIEMGIHLEIDNILTISTDDTHAYFSDNTIYHDFESRPEINFCCEDIRHPRPNHMGPPMILYAEYLQENHPNADISFIENDLKIDNIGNEEKYIQIFLEQYPEFNR